MPVRHAARPATDRQVAFLRSLAAEVYGEDWEATLRREQPLDDILRDSKRTSGLINFLIERRDAARAERKAGLFGEERNVDGLDGRPDVPAARYALTAPDGSLSFWQVDRPTKGKWAGYIFVKSLHGSPGDFRQGRVTRGEQTDILRRIAADAFRDGDRSLTGPEAAAVRFSRHFTVCAACLAPLTDEESRARGLGPICAKRF